MRLILMAPALLAACNQVSAPPNNSAAIEPSAANESANTGSSVETPVVPAVGAGSCRMQDGKEIAANQLKAIGTEPFSGRRHRRPLRDLHHPGKSAGNADLDGLQRNPRRGPLGRIARQGNIRSGDEAGTRLLGRDVRPQLSDCGHFDDRGRREARLRRNSSGSLQELERRPGRVHRKAPERVGEQGIAGCNLEQGEAGFQFHRIHIAENCGGSSSLGPAKDRLDRLAITLPEQRMARKARASCSERIA